jgi:hypothetical protein
MPGLRDEALATFGATCIDDFAPIGSRHAGTETVGAGAFEFAGLEGPLHGYSEGNGRKKVGEYVGFSSPMSNSTFAQFMRVGRSRLRAGGWLLLD